MNNRKKTFDAACREMLFDICRNHGLHLDYEPEYGGRAYLEKQDYILMRQKERMVEQGREIQEAQEDLDQLTMKIEDIETMINEVSEAAYDKAVEAVSEVVTEEIRNSDFGIIMDFRDHDVDADRRLSDKAKSVVKHVCFLQALFAKSCKPFLQKVAIAFCI